MTFGFGIFCDDSKCLRTRTYKIWWLLNKSLLRWSQSHRINNYGTSRKKNCHRAKKSGQTRKQTTNTNKLLLDWESG